MQEEKDEKIAGLIERLQTVQDKSKELERIYDYMHDLTKINITYNAADNDLIDKQLSDIFNFSEDISRSKLLFVREGAGTYTYCRKKVTF